MSKDTISIETAQGFSSFYKFVTMKQSFLGIMAALLVFSCAPVDQSVNQEPAYFIEVIDQQEISLDTFVQVLVAETDGAQLEESMDLIESVLQFVVGDKSVTAYVITYHTVDPLGNPVVASGTVYYPHGCKPRGVVEVGPVCYVQNTCGASERLPAVEAIQSIFGYITLMPDFLGYGVAKDLYHPFFDPHNNGRVAYDMRQASREFLRTLDFELPRETVVAGYSLGGSLALSMARYYQLYGQDVEVTKIAVGCGCYEPEIAFDVFSQTAYSEYALAPSVIYSIARYYLPDLNFEHVFTGALLEHYTEWLDRSDAHPSAFLNEHLTYDMHQYMHPDFFTEAKNETINRLYEVLRRYTHVDGWTPEGEVYLFHATDDALVPFDCGQYAYDQFKERGATVYLHKGPGGHVGYSVAMFVSLYVYLILR